MTRLSVLSAVRNEADHIREMIVSLQRQGFADWELVLVDDGSDDGTVGIVEEISVNDARVRLVAEQTAKGKVSAFNRAFESSRGDVVCLIGGDDRVPTGGLEARVAPFESVDAEQEFVMALFKLRTFSEDVKFDGMILPRGDAGSRSGGVMTMSKALASRVFPIPEHLVAEDVFLGEACKSWRPRTVTTPDVVLEYRIHPGNTNPRHQGFNEMTESTHRRARAWLAVLEDGRFELSDEQRGRLQDLWDAEERRYSGELWRLLIQRSLDLSDRLAMLSKSNRVLYAIRSRFYRLFSGWRGA